MYCSIELLETSTFGFVALRIEAKMNSRINIEEITPQIIQGIKFLFGQWFLMPITRLIIVIIKHGMNTKSIAPITIMNSTMNNHETTNIPMNAMRLVYTPRCYCATQNPLL